jgi:hypothetical protein
MGSGTRPRPLTRFLQLRFLASRFSHWGICFRRFGPQRVNQDILRLMSFRPTQIVAVIALLVCFVCPILELFDCWDNTAQTGNDTEYTLVLVSLCVGAAYSIARLLMCVQAVRPRPFGDSCNSFVSSAFVWFHLPETASSPPALSLRI